jgi:hypothetical protein
MKRILILTAGFGYGHRSAAQPLVRTGVKGVFAKYYAR